jgi:hypothetical protein
MRVSGGPQEPVSEDGGIAIHPEEQRFGLGNLNHEA